MELTLSELQEMASRQQQQIEAQQQMLVAKVTLQLPPLPIMAASIGNGSLNLIHCGTLKVTFPVLNNVLAFVLFRTLRLLLVVSDLDVRVLGNNDYVGNNEITFENASPYLGVGGRTRTSTHVRICLAITDV